MNPYIDIVGHQVWLFTTCIDKTEHVLESLIVLPSTNNRSACNDRTHEAPLLDDGNVCPTLYSSQDPCRVDMDLPLPVSL